MYYNMIARLFIFGVTAILPWEALLASPLPLQDPSIRPAQAENLGQAPPITDVAQNNKLMAQGIVFHDINGNGKFDAADSPFSKIKVSNGKQIVLTDELGRYALPVENDSAVFIIKPSGFRTPLTKNNLPKFFYLHKPAGSPKLKYPGVKPTGPLPQSIDFPLYRQKEPEDFKILFFGDPQPRNQLEVDYISHDVVAELVGDDSAFGVTLGDIAFDNLKTLKTLNESIAMIGIPWHNVIGNHDINLDAKSRKNINETFESLYGPSYYSFDYGQVHFVVLDNIDWSAPTQNNKRYHYVPNFGKEQLEFLNKDLSMIPESQMVVLMMHVPIMSTKDKKDLFKLIEKRPYCVSISGHTHDHRHMFLGKEDGFNGKEKHHHIVNVTVSGSWWSGAKNENGIPHTTMADGGPNGYSIMRFNEAGYQLDYKVAGRPASDQLRVHVPRTIDTNETGNQEVWVNVYNGSEKSTVQMSLDNSNWVTLEKKMAIDPYYEELAKRDAAVEPKLAKPKTSHHLWYGKLPAGIVPGTHLIRVKTTDMHGRTYQAHRSVRITGTPIPKNKESK
ncbi:MAG: calcineurin-like phosphoesterase family protein [Mariniblastus sp.]|nr:calcineurin-like phosphoesterase family protein [Mariniblastus sp.]